MKLNFMRKLRRKAGARFSPLLASFKGDDGEKHVFDSSHYIGACIISHYHSIRLKNRNDAEQRLKMETYLDEPTDASNIIGKLYPTNYTPI